MEKQNLNLAIESLLKSEYPLIDVRSPAEFLKGHIPGAVNLPLFTDEERAIIGTIYKQESPWLAIQKGMEIAIPKTDLLLQKARQLISDVPLAVYCWRGGMRSQSIATLLRNEGIHTFTLKGGYKSYRRFAENLFSSPLNITLLGGYTGCGKTEILHQLRLTGDQTLDLESLANHQGGSFGHIGQAAQPTTEHFHNLIAWQLFQFDPLRTIWIEDESRTLGSCHLPESLYKQMQKAPHKEVTCSLEERLKRLNKIYGHALPETWKKAISKISKKIGPEQAKKASEFIDSGNLREAALIILNYYDKCYAYARMKRSKI
jgi:tRNA 2-selenouridine synthase